MKQTKETYRELAAKFKNTRSEKSFTALYNKLAPRLRRYINGITKDSDATEDILSNAFTKIYLKIGTYDESYQITTWAYRIAYNECMGWFRNRAKGESRISFADREDGDESSFAELLLHKEDDPRTIQDHIDEDRLLSRKYDLTISAINQLKPMYKPYMVACFIQDKTYREIADDMSKQEAGVSLQTVKNRIFRGRKILRAELSAYPEFA